MCRGEKLLASPDTTQRGLCSQSLTFAVYVPCLTDHLSDSGTSVMLRARVPGAGEIVCCGRALRSHGPVSGCRPALVVLLPLLGVPFA